MLVDSYFIIKNQYRVKSLAKYKAEYVLYFVKNLITDFTRLHLHGFEHFWQHSKMTEQVTIVCDVFLSMNEAQSMLPAYDHPNGNGPDYFVVKEYLTIESKQNAL